MGDRALDLLGAGVEGADAPEARCETDGSLAVRIARSSSSRACWFLKRLRKKPRSRAIREF
jgi:hypothetical protein